MKKPNEYLPEDRERSAKPSPCGNYGDVSENGEITLYDASMIGMYLAGKIDLTPEQYKRGDVNGDGEVTQEDADLIAGYYMGYIDTFPICKEESWWDKYGKVIFAGTFILGLGAIAKVGIDSVTKRMRR